MKYQHQFKKAGAVRWQHFSRHGDAIFLSLKKEVTIGMLSAATLASACPDSSAARMAMCHNNEAEAEMDGNATCQEENAGLIATDVLLNGDLLFSVVSQSRDGIAAAIVNVTEGADLLRVSHVAIVCRDDDGNVFALEASSKHGVWLNPIDSFLKQNDHNADGKPMVVVGRLKDRSIADASVCRAKSYIGRPYDFQYLEGDSAIYCSELVHYAYLGHDGSHVFPQIAMSFHDRSGKVTDFWKEYYKKWDMDVPEGWPGTNPGEISSSDKIDIIGRFF